MLIPMWSWMGGNTPMYSSFSAAVFWRAPPDWTRPAGSAHGLGSTLVVTGMLNRQIAAELVIAEKTVRPRSNSAPACHGPDCP